MLIYKIFHKNEWNELQTNGKTDGAPVDIQDGYIHFSTAETVAGTALKYFGGFDGLILVAVKGDCDGLKWEPSRGGLLFPHLYRELLMEDVIWAKPLPCEGDGHLFPEGVL